jgi:manganese oxidase
MSLRSTVRRAGRLGTAVLVLALVAGVAFGLGRGSAAIGAARAQAPTTGYDSGVAGKTTPTGQVRNYELVASETSWEIAPGVIVPAIAYNRQVPGPTIRVMEGDTLRVTLKNELAKSTSIHWHGLHVPNAVDGVPGVTQAPIEPGQSYTYEFQASHAGTFMYHPHNNSVEQIDRGLYAPLIIDPVTPTATQFDKEFTMMLSAWDTNALLGGVADGHGTSGMAGMSMAYNYFTINGKAFPSNEPWTVREGDLVRARIINISNLAHPMHLHGGDFTVIAKDGEPIRPEIQQTMNTLSVDAGETFDIAFRADNPGNWVFHCHELHHVENDGVEPGGLIQLIQYEGLTAPASVPAAPAPTMPSTMPGMRH